MSEEAGAPPANLEGPAFSPFIKVLATGLVLSLALWSVRAAPALLGASWSPGTLAFLVAVLLIIVLGYYWIMASRTGISATHLHQTWMWDKKVALAEVTQAKFIFVPYLSWLIAPRLVVRVQGRGLYVFHAAHPAVLRAFARFALGVLPAPAP